MWNSMNELRYEDEANETKMACNLLIKYISDKKQKNDDGQLLSDYEEAGTKTPFIMIKIKERKCLDL